MKGFGSVVFLFVALSAFAGGVPVKVELSREGVLTLAERARLTLEFGRENWNCRAEPAAGQALPKRDGMPAGARGELHNSARGPRDGFFEVRCETAPDGAVDYVYEVTSDHTQTPAVVALIAYLPDLGMEGAKWSFDGGKSGVLPKASGAAFTASARTKRLTLELPYAKRTFTFETETPEWVSISNCDYRRHGGWGVLFSLGGKGPFAKGDRRTMKVRVGSADGLTVAMREPCRIEPSDEWVPLDYCKDIEPGTALDFSSMGLLDAPAGKYGWTRNVNGHFEFEGRPGVPQRFCGMNICGHSMYPTHAQADVLAERFARLGYNTFRIHTFEWKLLARTMDTLELDPEAMDRLDYLYAALVRRGCYATVDLFVCRCQPYLWRRDAGIDRDGTMDRSDYKLLVKVCDSAFENWARFAKNFMTHRNPYTGLRYADDPAMPFVVFVNEECFGWTRPGGLSIPEVRAAYRTWLAERRKSDPGFPADAPEDCAGRSLADPVVALFRADTDRAFVLRARAFLRSLGVKAMFSGFNCCDEEASLMTAKSELDYIDTHEYIDHPRFTGHNGYPHRIAGTVPPREQDKFAGMAFRRLPGKPFAVSEWNWGTMSRYRGVGGLSFGAFAALQDWNVLWRFTYSDGGEWWRPGEEGGYPSFTCSYDPMMLASERAVTCLFLRGDMAPAKDALSLTVGPAANLAQADGKTLTVRPRWKSVALGCRVGSSPAEVPGWKAFDLVRWGGTNATPPMAVTPSAGLSCDFAADTLKVVTLRTAGGFAFPGAELDCGALRFAVGKTAATVWASSLDSRELAKSPRILVSHLTDAQRQGTEYADADQCVALGWGKGGLLMRDGTAEISLRLEDPRRYRVFALRSDGRRLEEVPATAKDGRLSFRAAVRGRHGARYLYEVVKK